MAAYALVEIKCEDTLAFYEVRTHLQTESTPQ